MCVYTSILMSVHTSIHMPTHVFVHTSMHSCPKKRTICRPCLRALVPVVILVYTGDPNPPAIPPFATLVFTTKLLSIDGPASPAAAVPRAYV